MIYKTITKNPLFVILLALAAGAGISCNLATPQTGSGDNNDAVRLSPYFEEAVVNGRIDTREISESSGLANSRCNPSVLWTHNDSGDDNVIYALGLKGELLGKWSVTGAKNSDWEDIASHRNKSGECFLYIGDIGNNSRMKAAQTIYKVKEPEVMVGKSQKILSTENAEAIVFSYPDLRHDAEAIAVHPVSGEIYVITKRVTGAAGVYKLKNGEKTAVKIADISLPSMPNGMVTGADISPDGRHAIVCDYFGGFEFTLPDGEADFDKIWESKPRMVDLGTREQGEAVSYSSDGMAVFASSEHVDAPINVAKRKP